MADVNFHKQTREQTPKRSSWNRTAQRQGTPRSPNKVHRDLQKFQHAYAQRQTLDARAELIESELQKVYDGKRSRAILWRMQHPHLKMFRRDLDEELQRIEGRQCLAVNSARRKVEKKKAKLGKVAQTIADRKARYSDVLEPLVSLEGLEETNDANPVNQSWIMAHANPLMAGALGPVNSAIASTIFSLRASLVFDINSESASHLIPPSSRKIYAYSHQHRPGSRGTVQAPKWTTTSFL
ncbi:hypothetical protein C8035_v001943 [Colletotrichum spinosum]|uniref:Uncharacterized protein n=1 Tax=Colletotrichum spinosum TaxID=1347390 RepID=A0A4R8PXN9_9PEZI|nr:hypothetical protein C8035_v001943 [Colletotrichum spinosum]